MTLFICCKSNTVRVSTLAPQQYDNKNRTVPNNLATGIETNNHFGEHASVLQNIQKNVIPDNHKRYFSNDLQLTAQQYTLLHFSYVAKGTAFELLNRFSVREQRDLETFKTFDERLKKAAAIEENFFNKTLKDLSSTDISIPLFARAHEVIEITRDLFSNPQQIKQLVYNPEARYFLDKKNFYCIGVSEFNHCCQKIAAGTIGTDSKSFLTALTNNYLDSDIIRDQLPEVKSKLAIAKNKGDLDKKYVGLIEDMIHNVEVSLHNMDNEKRKAILESISPIPQEARPINRQKAAFLAFTPNPKIEKKSDDEIANILKALKAIPLELA